MPQKIPISVFIAIAPLFFVHMLPCVAASAPDYKGEKIAFGISPVGRAEYNDLGMTMLNGRMVRFCTFRTKAMGFSDTETIYSDPESGMPLRVERDIAYWLSKEYIVEEYDQKNFAVTIKKSIKGSKKQETIVLKGDGPIHNAILLPFSLRRVSSLGVGWTAVIRLPGKFKVILVSVEDMATPAGKFKAYHLTSRPNKFEIWISQDNLRLPLKIKGMGGLGYTLVMEKYEQAKER